MLTRRKFLGTTIGAGVALATGACATQPAGKRMIVDAQVHLWKVSGPDYPWNAGAKPQLPEPFTVERVVPLMDEASVDRVVIVPPALNEVNSYALEAVRRYPNRFAVMGRIPLQDPKSAALLPGWHAAGHVPGRMAPGRRRRDALSLLRRSGDRVPLMPGSRAGESAR